MKRTFTDYAHDSYEDEETVERLMEEFEWPEAVAREYVKRHKPMYEVKGMFEYDDETHELRVLGATIEGVTLKPVDDG